MVLGVEGQPSVMRRFRADMLMHRQPWDITQKLEIIPSSHENLAFDEIPSQNVRANAHL